VGKTTEIAWTDSTFNPWWGCLKISPACANCYAEKFDKRTGGNHWGPDSSRRFFGEKHWAEPLTWQREAENAGVRRRVFCGSMCDVMEDYCDLGPQRERLYALIEQTPNLDWLLLTKRPENFRRFLPPEWLAHPRPNVWGMATVESDDYHVRAWELLKTPFAVRGISVEPLLGPLDLDRWELTCKAWRRGTTIGVYLDWVIVGGESGPRARPFNVDWARRIVTSCKASGTAVFVKQMGAFPHYGEGMPLHLKHPKGGDVDEWPEDLRVREVPESLGKPYVLKRDLACFLESPHA
jgi:protein gp37